MVASIPIELNQLLGAPDSADREAAWEQLIARHTRLLVAVARSFGGDHDDAMERYSFILGKLRELDFRRLRAYDPNAGATFSTWLTVTARHLCLDHHRHRFGRSRPEHSSDRSNALRAVRRALGDLTEGEIAPDSIIDGLTVPSDALVVREHLNTCLAAELEKLTPNERLIIALRFEDDISVSRIAQITGLPTQFHAYRVINAILRRLRVALESQGIEGSDG